jgi:phosphate transport system ATP-binding protein
MNHQMNTTIIAIQHLSYFYGTHQALDDVSLDIGRNKVIAVIGPSGCGKSTLIKAINRIGEVTGNIRVEGEVLLNGKSVYAQDVDLPDLRRRVGMVFQKPNPFPKSIFENVAFGLRILGINDRERLETVVERSLRQAALWDEVKDRLHESALALSGGQQQRLCIARVLAVEPKVLLMDEPCSALDPIATQKIEDLMDDLKTDYTIIIVTHNMQQAARVSNRTAFMWLGRLIEYGETATMFTTPQEKLTEDYITGRFG